ncbi:hypothetical protein C9F04_10855 [Salmonella enterica subsp. enterica serovar Wilhelmsburg]|uniref:Cytochrome c-type biogenesis protein n=7 Tax=Salmonella enterica TaxID=28901 RepID=A0A659QNS6_SALET|nr:hypothetical protein C9F04_10855 [Salmonella enterica subsp. enterica serovar Wilhelmsburg]
MRLLPGMVMLMLVLVIAGSARATTDVMPFKDEAQEQQFRQLTEQLRCPKCQNNSIADSNAMIATDMRRRVYDLMQEGKSRQEIIDYMVARYGNFVTYDPPLTPLTVLLWVLPLAAIVAGGWIIVARTRRRVRLRREPLPADTPVCGARAGWGVYVPGAVIALAVGAGRDALTGRYQLVRAWPQAPAQPPGRLARVTGGGGACLLWYGFGALKTAMSSNLELASAEVMKQGRWKIIATMLAVTWLNPHVYLDTFVVLGSLGGQLAMEPKRWFALGTISASFLWFFGLALLAAWLAPRLRTAKAQRIINILVGVVMWLIAFQLAREGVAHMHALFN